MKKKVNFKIRKAAPSDLIQIYGLIKELAIFEKEPNEPSNPIKRFILDGSNKDPKFHVLVAEDNSNIVGMALYYYGYSSWKGAIIYLDDLVVQEKYRKSGIGKKLMDELISIAKKEKINQVRWHVLDWNENAINFYKKYPVTFDKTWVTCKIENENLV